MKKNNKKASNKQAASANKKLENIVIPTLLDAMDKVSIESDDSQLSDEFYLKVAPEIGLLCDSFGITERQAVLFSVSLQRGPYRVDFSDFASHFDLSRIKVLSLASDIDALVCKRLLRYRDAKDRDSFDIPNEVVNALKRNEAYVKPNSTGLDCFELLDEIDHLFDDLDNNSINPQSLTVSIRELMADNPNIDFVQKFNSLGIKKSDNWLLLMWMCNRVVNHDDNDFRLGEIEELYPTRGEYSNARAKLRSGENVLMTNNLVEHKVVDGMADNNRMGITDHAKALLLSEFKINNCEEKVSNLIKAESLQAKQLFYNEGMDKQVDEITSLLSPAKYNKIIERMRKKGFRQGFTCLFYGAAGTGKTETVYQLARATGRDIMLVDVPQIKSKWVGDSEKNIKAVFDRYREAIKHSKQAPILLFNEADAIFGVRKNEAQNAVDKMENTVQNIILQEMEQLEGILIATTNLEQNLDSAFERRFLYKLKFERPSSKVRAKIWQSMLAEITETDALALADQFELSGGQIENVARKFTINDILFGCKKGQVLKVLKDYCKNETLSRNSVARVGFC
ncbi:MAG: ATP-binding protein [Muribaculaceae bacterium]|nr:ATP-binding protein [Muribaculaceae bacterium]MBQ5467261.1 ATP-binding protein [Muribaculaceae bacterium]